MKQKLQLQIPEPCHENWNNMSPTQQGRFCMSCKKEVIDFSVMSDKEILDHISNASKSMCGRTDNTQLNRVLTQTPEPRSMWWKYWMGIAASFVMITSKSTGQVTKPVDILTVAPGFTKGDTLVNIVAGGVRVIPVGDKKLSMVQGRILNENGDPIPYASIKLCNSRTGVAADSGGYFTLNINTRLSKLELEVTSVGYEARRIKLNDQKNIQPLETRRPSFMLVAGDIVLKQQVMGKVVIVAPSSISRRTTGLMATCVRYTTLEKIKNIVNGDKEIKAYPNPVNTNNNFKLVFNLKDPGEYHVQFTDVSGRIISEQQLNITLKNQLESFNGNIFRAAGTYFASVSGKNTKLYTTRLLVQ